MNIVTNYYISNRAFNNCKTLLETIQERDLQLSELKSLRISELTTIAQNYIWESWFQYCINSEILVENMRNINITTEFNIKE